LGTVLWGYFAVVAFNGLDDVALVFLAKDTLGGSDAAAGLLLGAVGVGLFLGYALLSRPHARVSMIGLLLAGFTVSSLGKPAVLQGLEGLRAGDELIVLTWLDRAHRDVLRVHPRGDTSRAEHARLDWGGGESGC
jgi:hypothetical protein